MDKLESMFVDVKLGFVEMEKEVKEGKKCVEEWLYDL